MLCAIEPRLRLKRSPPQAGLEPGTARSVVDDAVLRLFQQYFSDIGTIGIMVKGLCKGITYQASV